MERGFSSDSIVTGVNLRIKDASGNIKTYADFTPNAYGVVEIPATHTLEIRRYLTNANGTLKYPFVPHATQPWVEKAREVHTFFPPDKSYEWIMEQFISAKITNSHLKQPWGTITNAVEAPSESGMIFRWFEGGNSLTYFPKY